MRMPSLVLDEVLLLMDTYFRIKKIDNRALKQLYIEELSENMKMLPFFPEMIGNPNFRNIAGMSMMLNTVALLDPQTKSYKMHKPSKLQTRVFKYYEDKQSLLRDLAEAIINLAAEGTPANLFTTCDFIGGSILLGTHLQLEENDKTLQQIKAVLLKRKTTVCGICGRDLENIYGRYATELMEVHYTYPLGKYRANMQVISSFVTMLCPTCHKLAHSDVILIEEEALKAAIIQ